MNVLNTNIMQQKKREGVLAFFRNAALGFLLWLAVLIFTWMVMVFVARVVCTGTEMERVRDDWGLSSR